MSSDDAQESFQAFSPTFNNFFREPVGEHLSRKRGDVHSCGFMFENITKSLKVGIAATNERMTQFEGRNISLSNRGVR